jgi:hypothetical protein
MLATGNITNLRYGHKYHLSRNHVKPYCTFEPVHNNVEHSNVVSSSDSMLKFNVLIMNKFN